MGILFWRRVSRIGVSVAWPPIDPGTWVFEKHATLIVPELRPRPPREVIPTTTFSTNQARGHAEPMGRARDSTADLGLSAKIGLTSTVTLDATVNPDFSQVESDAFQVQVNQRFPVFFPEKRPFFMEGAGIFTLAGTQDGDQSLYSAVNTRNIVNPIGGAKITGNAGRAHVRDADRGRRRRRAVDADRPTPASGENRMFNVVRAEYSLKPGSYAARSSPTPSSRGSFNRVTGADLSLKPTLEPVA